MGEREVQLMKQRLKEIEEKTVVFNKLAKEEDALQKKLTGIKKQLVSLKEQYDSLLVEYADAVIEAVDVNSERRRLADVIQVERPGDWLVSGFAYYGNLNGGSREFWTHKSITPNVVGYQAWNALVAYRRERGGQK